MTDDSTTKLFFNGACIGFMVSNWLKALCDQNVKK